MCEDAGSGAHVDADFCARRKSRIAARRRRGPGCSPGSGWVNEWEGGREKGWGERTRGRVAENPRVWALP